MRSKIARITFLFGVLFFMWAPVSTAEIPAGKTELIFKGGKIYELSLPKECISERLGGDSFKMCMSVDIIPNGKGKFTGTARFKFSGLIDGKLVGPASGSVAGEMGGKGKASIKLVTTGTLSFQGAGTRSSSMDYECGGNVSAKGIWNARCKLVLEVQGFGKDTSKGGIREKLKGTVWGIKIDVDPINKKTFSGKGKDRLGNKYKVAGKYNPDDDTSAVEITGKGAAKGARISLKGLTDDGKAKAKINVQGYTGSGKVKAVSP